MTSLDLCWQAGTVPAFDLVVEEMAEAPCSFTEADALREAFWAFGEDARLREDERFQPTPWGRWMLARATLVNDQVWAYLQQSSKEASPLMDLLVRIELPPDTRPVF